jgi:death-on-curing protein
MHVILVDWGPGEQPSIALQSVRVDLLDSACNVIRQDYYRGLFLKAAVLLRSLAKNHAFIDGNKRTAVVACIIFLLENGYVFRATNEELVNFTLRIARGQITNIYKIKSWLEKRSRPLTDFKPEQQKYITNVLRQLRKAFSSFKNKL